MKVVFPQTSPLYSNAVIETLRGQQGLRNKQLNGFNHSLNLEKTRPNPNPTLTPTRGITFSQLKHVRSLSNFQDIFLIIYQPDLWCQIWPHSSRLQSGTFIILQVQNLYFLSQIMSDLDQFPSPRSEGDVFETILNMIVSWNFAHFCSRTILKQILS